MIICKWYNICSAWFLGITKLTCKNGDHGFRMKFRVLSNMS